MEESILNHLFLPHYLPSSADDDFIIGFNCQYEYKILEYIKQYLDTFELTNAINNLPIFQILNDYCLKSWSILQNSQNFSGSTIQNIIEELPPGSFLPLYFRAQNAAILIEIEENNIDQPLISSWQVLLPMAEIASSPIPHLSCFPVTTYRLKDRRQLNSKVHCELLVDFMKNTIEYSKSYPISQQRSKVNDVPESHYVTQWWIQQFQDIQIENNSNMSIQFKKKHRDHIRGSGSAVPCRRSGLWLTIKVVFQTILTKRLGSVGTVVYKLLITHFLACIICQTYSTVSTDLLVYCIRKIVRRLNKIENLLSSIQSNDVNDWIQYTTQEIRMKINQIIPKSDWQNPFQVDEETNQQVFMSNFTSLKFNTYQHLCEDLKAYLNNQTLKQTITFLPGVKKSNVSSNAIQADYIPSIKELTEKFNYTIGIALNRIEIWVELCLDKWINRSTITCFEGNQFETLLIFFEEYQNAALNHYWSEKDPTDPLGYSRFILTPLTIIRSMHQKLCNNSRFERLKLHYIHIPNLMNLFEFLVLPNREDMIRIHDLRHYFSHFSHKEYPDLLTNINSADAFGVYYAYQSSTMKESIQKIRIQAENDKQQKIREVNNAKERYRNLMNSVRNISCKCTYKYGYRQTCHKCSTEQQASQIQVKIFECPLPSDQNDAFAVIFELQMPIEVRVYRDVIWQFVNRPKPHPKLEMYEWLSVPPHAGKLRSFYHGSDNYKVKLVSSTRSVTQIRDSCPPSIAFVAVEEFLFENSLTVGISPTKPIEFNDECRILTPQLDHPDYKQLQFTLNTTQFLQNDVIAKLSDCSIRLKPNQFVEFGSFRSGHRLQWWNLLAIFEMDSLPISEESVTILIIHSILQYGPQTSYNSWCSEAHEQLLEDHFIDELITRLDRRLDDCELNWQHELVLVAVTIITMRMLTICNSTREVRIVDLAMKCCRIGEKWIALISETIQNILSSAFNEIEKLRLKNSIIGISCILTFSTNSDRLHYLLSSNEHIISLLKAATTIHDNIILNKNQTNMSTFVRNIMRFSERILVTVQPTIAEYLRKTSYQSLNDFSTIYWAAIRKKGTMNGKWRKRKQDPYDGWYDCRYELRCISIDCIRGTFLVDDMTIGFLPENITTNELFVRVFHNHIFEVQLAESPKTYITKHSYHGDRRVQYEFYFNDQTKCLKVTERHIQTNETFQLIPHTCFQKELSDTFISNHSHWMNIKTQIIEFRPIHFKEPDFLDNKSYILSLETGYVITTIENNAQTLINQSSIFFQQLFHRYFIRLDDKPYVYMMHSNISCIDSMVYIYLSRLNIAFEYNTSTHIIKSREYSDMRIDKDQWLGTLTGLTHGLLLSPLQVNHDRLYHYPYRKLIVPFGTINSEINYNMNHQIVTINRSSSKSFTHQYFVFILNDRLKIVQSTDSPTGWLYLALLHAMTSHPLPDQYTGMTGMERAFQLLNSAGCWSDQPFDEVSLNILCQIASISPKVDYYPQKTTVMEKIDWNSNGIPYSMQHFGYYLITKKLIDSSQIFNFMYPSMISHKMPELFQGKIYNEILLKKLYWDYRDSYNPQARLSIEMEADILGTKSMTTYHPTFNHYSHLTNNRAVRLIDDLYNNGYVDLRDCSQQHWLPLSQWLTASNNLKNIWIGLLKLTERIKTVTTDNNADNVKRLEGLLDFLHYISGKRNINPFYLQMLKTNLKISTISLRSVRFPPFIRYNNIEQIRVQRDDIDFSNDLTSRQQSKILAEIRDCFENGDRFEDYDVLLTDDEISEINGLLKAWRSNKELRYFLETVQYLICSVPLEQFNIQVPCYPQRFAREQPKDHYQIQIKLTDISIDPILLRNAEQKFHNVNSDHFNKPTKPISTTNRQNMFPQDIFPSLNNQDKHLSEIMNYFKNQLDESWNKLLSDQPCEKEYPSTEEIIELLNSFREESIKFWDELLNSIRLSNEQLFDTGLILRITPMTVITLLQDTSKYFQNHLLFTLTKDQCTILGAIIVNWTLEQQLERTLHFATHYKFEDLKKELSHIPHSNWKPSEYISWLILELEMNITIREIQIKVAQHMIQPKMIIDDSTVQNIVMQMNMGEGKTSVILPMLAVNLSSSNSTLVRIIILKSLFPTNYQSLRYKLGGLLNRRIFPFTCRRDMNFNDVQINQIFKRFQEGLKNCDIILTSPEDILSFDLLTIDKCRRNEFNVGRSMLTVQRWLKNYVRDVLDESDEILHVKYQLIYTIGGQQQVDGGAERWKTIQTILKLVKKHATDISNSFYEYVYYKPSERKSAFPQFRLQSYEPFRLLCQKIANDWIDSRNYRSTDKSIILSFILETHLSVECLVDKFSRLDIQLFLIIRGLLSSEVLLVALKKRYRVNYGVNLNPSFNRLMAVPFRAKDVVADRTEFGHPDVALVLTQLSYYYSGLNDSQLSQCFNRLNHEETDPVSIYDQWILYEDEKDIANSIKQWNGVNLKDYQQCINCLFPTFRYNMLVIDYFLDYFVFPREAKQFPYKLTASGWDLSSSLLRSKIITGFSGTNDTQLLLPVHIRQYDLSELQKTDAIVVNNLLQNENENYQFLSINITLEDVLKQIVDYKEKINVILDVGALFIDGTNKDIAIKWLKLSNKNNVDYAVYFDSDSIVVCDRLLHHYSFVTSPANERLDRCIFYLDEIHTRGTDFKFPIGFKAAVTLGNGLTKDRFVQACMRMRKLGSEHSLTFWSSYEVHQQIQTLKTMSLMKNQENNINESIKLIDILRWVYENTQQATWDGLHH
ncbi:unnamed protein product [Rotaria sordida]|uniref:ubiquitinyl hydrolase 1 n=3 Tax=Rotaria sordida TaxID=392033 RepID=A0A813Y454_9BILA|nr:unnamed protein product [Rotaria sordida]